MNFDLIVEPGAGIGLVNLEMILQEVKLTIQ